MSRPKNTLLPEDILGKINQMIRGGKGARIVMYRGDTPVFRADIKSAELTLGTTLALTTVGTEIHASLAGKTIWSPTGQKGETRTGIRFSEYTNVTTQGSTVKFTKPPYGKELASSYVIEPITD